MKLRLFSIVVGTAGWILLIWQGHWQISVPVFLVLWANNLDHLMAHHGKH